LKNSARIKEAVSRAALEIKTPHQGVYIWVTTIKINMKITKMKNIDMKNTKK
jgi:hypothetical protein